MGQYKPNNLGVLGGAFINLHYHQVSRAKFSGKSDRRCGRISKSDLSCHSRWERGEGIRMRAKLHRCSPSERKGLDKFKAGISVNVNLDVSD